MKDKVSEASLLKKRYSDNPFTTPEGFVVPKRKKMRYTGITEQEITVKIGNDEMAAEVRTIDTVDSEPFVKIFTQEIKRFFGLSNAAMRIVTLMLEDVGNMKLGGSDQVYMTEKFVQKAMIECDLKPISTATYYRAIYELIEKGFIAPTENPPLFFINPAIFFNGDRIKFTRELRKRQENDNGKSAQKAISSGAEQDDLGPSLSERARARKPKE